METNDVLDASCSASVVSDLDQNVIKSKIDSGEYKLQLKKGKSKAWDIFKNILNVKGEIISSHVCCKSCCKVLKYNSKSTSNLIKHKCYIMKNTINQPTTKVDVDAETRRKTAILCTRWTLENCRPFKIVQDSGFTKIVEESIKIGAKFGPNVSLDSLLPHPSTISRNIEKLYDIHSAKIKTDIREIKEIGFALTSDLWTDNYLRKSFIALTIHYISNGCMCCKLLSMLSMEGEKATNENILRKVTNSLHMYGCEIDKSTMVTDRGANMVAAFKLQNHVFCIAHFLHNVVQKSMMAVEEVAKLSRCCTKLVKYFKITVLNSSFKTSLKSYSPTRWNSVYAVFISIENNWADIVHILQERNELSRINDVQLNHITDVIATLKPFQEAFDKLKGEKYPTIHLVYMYAHYLKKKCCNAPTDSEYTTRFKTKILENIEAVVFVNLKLIHKLAIYLFPPTTKMQLFESSEKETVRYECKRIMGLYVDLLPVRTAQDQITLTSDEPMSDFLDETENESSIDQIGIEIATYESMVIKQSEDFNVLQWWELHKGELPLLYYASCKVLCIPATSATSERIFSQARNLISEKRCKIASNHESVNKIMFLHCNINQNNFQIEDVQ